MCGNQPVNGDVDELLHQIFGRVAFQHIAASVVDDLTLLIHHIVVLQQMLTHLEIARFDLLLCPFDRAGDHTVLDHLTLFSAELVHHAADAFRTEQPHQVVFQR